MQDLHNKVAVITGAGGALGQAFAEACAARGMRLMLADVDAAAVAAAEAALRQRFPGLEVASQRLDVARWEEVAALAEQTQARFGAAHLLFNNAGVGVAAPVWENTVADWQWVTQVNLYGVAWGVRAFVPMMLHQGEGHVVNVASAAGWVSPAGSGIYNATKAAVVALSESLANDLALGGHESAVGVSVLSPAFFPSGIAHSERNRPAALADTVAPGGMRARHEAQVRRAVATGDMSAAEVAAATLAAVAARRFYVFPHAWVPKAVGARAKAAAQGERAFDPLARPAPGSQPGSAPDPAPAPPV